MAALLCLVLFVVSSFAEPSTDLRSASDDKPTSVVLPMPESVANDSSDRLDSDNSDRIGHVGPADDPDHGTALPSKIEQLLRSALGVEFGSEFGSSFDWEHNTGPGSAPWAMTSAMTSARGSAMGSVMNSALSTEMGSVVGSWDGRFSSPGLGGAVTDIVADGNGNVYMAGAFLTTGGLESSVIAMWDGTRWHTLGTGEIDGLVLALAVDDQGVLYAGGQFETIRGTSAKALAKWDGSTWTSVGTGLDNYMPVGGMGGSNEWVSALEFGPDGTLYAGGVMTSIDGVTVNNIAMYDGTSWATMGGGLTCCQTGFGSAGVQTIAVTPNNTVYAGGKFGETNNGGQFIERLVSWNGTSWNTLMHVHGPIIDIAVDGNDNVYVGGDFSHMRPDFHDGPSIVVNRMIYSSDAGASWNRIGSEPNVGFERASGGAEVYGVAMGTDGKLYVAGDFETVQGMPAHNAAVLDGSVWSEFAGGVGIESDDALALALAETASGWYFGGLFAEVGDLAGVGNIALHTGSDWAALGAGLTYIPGLSGVPYSMAVDAQGQLYASGLIAGAGGVAVGGAAYFDGTRWFPLGDQFTQPVDEIEVTTSGKIYAAGRFARPDFSVFNVAEWDGTAWVEVGQLGTLASSPPMELGVDSQGNLYAGGTAFQTLNGVAVPGGFANLVMWNGTEWSVVGGDADGSVRVIYVDDSDNLYIGGTFDEVGGMAARGIAMWDGTAWTSFGLGFRDAVQAIVRADDGTLYAGGEFETTDFANPLNPASGVPAKYVAKWDGTAWSQVGAGLNDEVEAIAVGDDGTLYAAGVFTADGSEATTLNYIAGFDGTSWSELGGGVDAKVNTLLFVPGAGLYVGGELKLVGGQTIETGRPSGGIALWKPSGSVANEELATQQQSVILRPNYPNPFAEQTTIPFELQAAAHVQIAVFDVLGQRVAEVVNANFAPGYREIAWNAASLPSGLYFYRLRSGDVVENRTMTIVR